MTYRPGADARLDDAELLDAFEHRGDVLLRVVCDRCGGGKRAGLGAIVATRLGAVVAVELSMRPQSATRSTVDRPELPGWRDRGGPDAVLQLLALDDGWPDETTITAYCARLGSGHGSHGFTVAELRVALARPGTRGGKRRVLVA